MEICKTHTEYKVAEKLPEVQVIEIPADQLNCSIIDII